MVLKGDHPPTDSHSPFQPFLQALTSVTNLLSVSMKLSNPGCSIHTKAYKYDKLLSLKDPSMLQHTSILCCILWQNNVPVMDIPCFLFFHLQWTDFWVVPMCLPLEVTHHTQLCDMFLWLFHLLGIYPAPEYLDTMVTSCLTLSSYLNTALSGALSRHVTTEHAAACQVPHTLVSTWYCLPLVSQHCKCICETMAPFSFSISAIINMIGHLFVCLLASLNP